MEGQGFDIKSWAEEDRPREKLLLKGKAALSDAEIIGILINSGTANLSAVDIGKLILKDAGNDLNKLAKFSVKDLMKFKGIGEAKAISIVSALELGRRRRENEPEKQKRISSSRDVYDVMKADLLDLSSEEFWILLLNRANNVIHKQRVSTGGISGTIADPKVIFKYALENSASSIIFIHNHPSGNLNPSEADKQLTVKMKQAGRLLEITVLDHLIFTDSGFFSFADENLI
jgi:DNA repair protein RadC